MGAGAGMAADSTSASSSRIYLMSLFV
jgi:hypothetical protein